MFRAVALLTFNESQRPSFATSPVSEFNPIEVNTTEIGLNFKNYDMPIKL
jgi:hypothetical protein